MALMQMSGDCKINVCDAKGGQIPIPDDSDLPTGFGCWKPSCNKGNPVLSSTCNALKCMNCGDDGLCASICNVGEVCGNFGMCQ
jgi:hypothetical protein